MQQPRLTTPTTTADHRHLHRLLTQAAGTSSKFDGDHDHIDAILEAYPQAYTLISNDAMSDDPIGYLSILPSSADQKFAYLRGRLSEHDLVDQIIQEQRRFATSNAIYLHDGYVEPKHWMAGQASNAATKHILDSGAPGHATIYAGTTSGAGLRALKKIAKNLGTRYSVKGSTLDHVA